MAKKQLEGCRYKPAVCLGMCYGNYSAKGSVKGEFAVLTANLLSAIVTEAIQMEGVSCLGSNQ